MLAPPRSPRRTSWNPGGTLAEISWNLTSGPPRTPKPIRAETPKLPAVGGKKLPEGIIKSVAEDRLAVGRLFVAPASVGICSSALPPRTPLGFGGPFFFLRASGSDLQLVALVLLQARHLEAPHGNESKGPGGRGIVFRGLPTVPNINSLAQRPWKKKLIASWDLD